MVEIICYDRNTLCSFLRQLEFYIFRPRGAVALYLTTDFVTIINSTVNVNSFNDRIP